MGTWAVTSGIAEGLRDNEAHPFVYGRYVNAGQYIVHEASPTSSGNLEWLTAQLGDISFDEINKLVDSLPRKPPAMSSSCPSCTAVTPGLR